MENKPLGGPRRRLRGRCRQQAGLCHSFLPCFSHPPPRGSQKLVAPTVAAAFPLPAHLFPQGIRVGGRSSPRPSAAARSGALPLPSPSPGPGGSRGGGGAWQGGHSRPKCPSPPGASLSPVQMSTAPGMWLWALNQLLPINRTPSCVLPSVGFLITEPGVYNPPNCKCPCCPRNTLILVTWCVT